SGWMLTHQAAAGTHIAAGGQIAVGGPTSAAGVTRPHAGDPADAAPVPARVLKPVSALAFGPYRHGQGEDSSPVRLAIDASQATSWHTQWYATARFGNLKPGTGLLLDMGKDVTVTSVRVLLGSASGADLQLRAGDEASSLAGLRPVARATGAG